MMWKFRKSICVFAILCLIVGGCGMPVPGVDGQLTEPVDGGVRDSGGGDKGIERGAELLVQSELEPFEHPMETKSEVFSESQQCPSSCVQASDCAVASCGGKTSCLRGSCGVPVTGCVGGCPVGKVCEEVSRRCVDCLKDSDCADSAMCEIKSKTCQPKTSVCKTDADCVSSALRSRCHTAYSSCVQCTLKSHCKAWEICFTDLPSCGRDVDCLRRAFTCVQDPKGCASDAGCPPGRHCETGSRRCLECTKDSHCSSGQRCDLKQFTCRGVSTFCAADGDCVGGKRCLISDKRCVECLVSGDCQSNEWCTVLNVCQKAGSCSVPSDCLSDQVCETSSKACTGCLVDSDCGWEQRCDVKAKSCVGCLADSDCGPYSYKICKVGACVAGCRTSRGCPSTAPYCKLPAGGVDGRCVSCLGVGLGQCPQGKMCDVSSGGCIERTSTVCASAGDCALGSYCDLSQKRCISGCQTDRDCPRGAARCHRTLKKCVVCEDDGQCSKGMICEVKMNRCVSGCRSSRDCSAQAPSCDVQGQVCYLPCTGDVDCSRSSLRLCDRTRGRCVGCRSDKDCYGGQKCLKAQCAYPTCKTNSDCVIGSVCNVQASQCRPGCRGDVECTKAGEICLEGVCRVGCRLDAQCVGVGRVEDRFCLANRCVECKSGSDCAGGLRCSSYGRCYKGCDLSGGDSYCALLNRRTGEVRCDKSTGMCAQCLFDAHCGKGERCFEKKCVLVRLASLCKACTKDVDCGQGNLCIGYPCEKSAKERACGAACDPANPCPGGYRCVSIVRGGKSYKQCVPLLYRDRCDGVFGGTCAGGRAFGKSCRGNRDAAGCGLKGVFDAYCPSGEFYCTVFCKSDGDCPSRYECKGCSKINPGWGVECENLYSPQEWSICVEKRSSP